MNHEQVCPSCGYCPTCGRKPNTIYPSYPYWYPTYPTYPQPWITYTISTETNTVAV